MAASLSRIFSVRMWRGALHYFRALLAHDRVDRSAALHHFEEWLRWDTRPRSQDMALYALLLNADDRRRAEVAPMLSRVVAGEFHRSPPTADDRYAEAYAHYILGYLTNRSDLLQLWLRAYSLKTENWFASKYLPLPTKPLLV